MASVIEQKYFCQNSLRPLLLNSLSPVVDRDEESVTRLGLLERHLAAALRNSSPRGAAGDAATKHSPRRASPHARFDYHARQWLGRLLAPALINTLV